ncbi:MAG: threonine aldolase family protein [Calditrichaeota bacterium]|nr:threonine aldolase family protein [Calditrichota bacterium]MCB9367078.1 threonine aldolase family protein [Calditrichota bacterium]MCB9391438.1 threonine aldolase family protein [Calditrichota bacterium]
MLDLRSDTITKPTGAMRQAMASAEVGDDQFGEDPTVNLLQERVAELFGKESSLFFPTTTMANQCAIRTLTHPGDEVICTKDAHIVLYEAGGIGANSGAQLQQIGAHGRFTCEEFESNIKGFDFDVNPPTKVVAIENTHNRSGGRIFPYEEITRIATTARERGIASYCDGARIWNAAEASGRTVAELAGPFDLVSACFSKGLGCPAGSVLVGSREVIQRATRYRRMLGGAMRQSGILAAACLHALDHHLEHLHADHKNAKLLAGLLAACPLIELNPESVETNIVIFDLKSPAPGAREVEARAQKLGVSFFAFGPRTIRLVTHRDISTANCEKAAHLILKAIEQ